MRPILLLSCAWLLATSAQATGPSFPSNVTSSTTNPDFILEDTNGVDWAMEGDEPVANAFAVSYGDFNTHPFVIENLAPENSLRISSSGRIGIGTAAPALDDLEIADPDGNGAATIGFLKTLGGAQTWRLGVTRAGDFLLLDATNGRIPLTVSASAAGRIDITTSGILISGSVVQLSSRESKTDFRQVEPRQVLAKVLDLPMAYWRYKTEEKGVRHLGPMAEDFHAAFGLGPDDQGIPLLDAGGVALAAIQGLKAEQDERMAKKDREFAVLEGELAELRELVSQLMAAEARSQTQGAYVGDVNW